MSLFLFPIVYLVSQLIKSTIISFPKKKKNMDKSKNLKREGKKRE